MYINQAYGDNKSGLYLSAAFVGAAAAALSLVDLHKRQLRLRKRRRLEHTRSVVSNAASTFSSSTAAGGANNAFEERSSSSSSTAKTAAPASAASSASLLLMGGSASSAAGLPVGVNLPAVASYNALFAADESSSANSGGEGKRRASFTDRDDLIPPVGLLTHQRSFVVGEEGEEEDFGLVVGAGGGVRARSRSKPGNSYDSFGFSSINHDYK